ncbi:MAG TPA: cupredoxin domain-containing protein [Longimicrobiales bacterium]|nr:cupredoxin domain-containing protein [Longimicrobiales bacterium]
MNPRISVWTRAQGVGLVLACLMAACGDEPIPTSSNDDDEPQAAVIQMQDNDASPATLLVQVGDVVEWRNVGINHHSVLDYGSIVAGAILPAAVWQEKSLAPGEYLRHVFERPGEYSYICGYHGEVGGIVVSE